jgi:predicted exporter
LSRSIRLGLWFVLALALGGSVPFIRVDADLGGFVSAEQLAGSSTSVALQRCRGRLVLIALNAPTPRATADASRKLVDALRATGLFATLHNGDSSLLAAEFESIVPYRYLLSDRVEEATFSESHLRASLLQAQAMLADSRSWVVSQLLPADPTLETLHLTEQWAGSARLPMRHGVWFTKSGTEALIVGMTRAAGDDADAQRPGRSGIRQAASAGGIGAGLNLCVRYTGLGLLAGRHSDTLRVEWLGGQRRSGHRHPVFRLSAAVAGCAVTAAGRAWYRCRLGGYSIDLRRRQCARGRVRLHPG